MALYLLLKIILKLWNGVVVIMIYLRNIYFQERYIGEGARSGVSIPDTLKIAEAYGIAAARVNDLSELDEAIQKALDHDGPYILELITPSEQPIVPTVSSHVNADGSMSSRPLEDMAPFLDREEYLQNLIVSPI